MKVSLIGMGAGESFLSGEALLALKGAGLILGAERLLENLPRDCTGNRKAEIKTQELLRQIHHSKEGEIAVVFSGDTGFYSGAEPLAKALGQEKIAYRVYPGISSVQLFAARLGRPWQNWLLVSAHGRECDPVACLMQKKETFFLTGGENTAAALCQKLAKAGLGFLKAEAGQNLGMLNESIISGTVQELSQKTIGPLAVLLVQPPEIPFAEYGAALPDEAFERGKVPMTKQNIRAAILAALHPQAGEVCWDVGGGTGSVAVMLSRCAKSVYSAEVNAEAFALMQRNREKLGAWNMTPVLGKAPEALAALPKPDKVFIGGSKGSLAQVLQLALEKNKAVRVCASAVTLETLHTACEAMQAQGMAPQIFGIAVSEAKPVGALHMMTAQNPVWLITGEKV